MLIRQLCSIPPSFGEWLWLSFFIFIKAAKRKRKKVCVPHGNLLPMIGMTFFLFSFVAFMNLNPLTESTLTKQVTTKSLPQLPFASSRLRVNQHPCQWYATAQV
jgi:hypothetical protein